MYKIIISAKMYNELYSEKTGIVIDQKCRRISDEKVDFAINLLKEVVDNDGDRYNRPSYWFKAKNFIKEING